jgi:putative peptide zinc metalloprotease protein
MKPRLRPHVQITRQHYRARRWHVVHDPTSNQFYRLNPIAHDFVGMLDGARDVETAWKASLAKFGDAAPTQNEIIQLISQLYQSNLLSVDSSPETEQLLRRGRERLKKKAAAQAIGIMYFKIPVFNPDRILSACEPVLRPVLNRWGLLAWAALILWALVAVLPYSKELSANFNAQTLFEAKNLWLVPLAFILTKAVHEFGHGVICKRFGGQVPEFGFMLLVLLPSPYVDASAAWAFASKWKRVAVGAAGMMFELVVAAVAALVWVSYHQQGAGEHVVARFCYNVMITAGISTILFNANPLMRFDGYYILADLLETPNLAQRSNKMMLHLIQKYIYRLKNLTPPTTLAGERSILLIYGVLAFAYRIFLFITITLFVMGQFFAIGLFLAIWTTAAWFLMPIGKFVHWLATNPALSDKRARTAWISAGMVAAGVLAIGVVPFPDRRKGSGVVEGLVKTGVFFDADGFVAKVHKRPGDRVAAGEPIVTLENDDLIARRDSILSQIEELAIQQRAGVSEGDPATAMLAQERIRIARENLEEIDRRIGGLVVRAPHDGVVVAADPAQRLGGYVRRGESVCEVVDTAAVRVTATLDQRQARWLFTPEGSSAVPLRASVRLLSDVNVILPAESFEALPAGQRLLPSPALSLVGGGQFEPDAQDQSGRVSKRPQFNVRILFDDPAGVARIASPGERVRVKFDLPARPLLAQWIERLGKEMQGRVQL